MGVFGARKVGRERARLGLEVAGRKMERLSIVAGVEGCTDLCALPLLPRDHIFRWLYRGREKYSEDGGTTFGENRRFEMWFPASAPSVPAPSTLHSYPASSLYRFLLTASLHSHHLQNVLYDRWPRY